MPKIDDIEKWRVELELAEDFRNKEFGEYQRGKISLAGYNIEYFDRGISGPLYKEADEFIITTLNLFHAIVKNIVPSLHFQNPKILAFPKKVDSQDTAPIVGETMNHYYKFVEAEEVNNKVIWDAYVLGYGVSKVGYATKFGMDVPGEEKKKKSLADKLLETIGLKKPAPPEEPVFPEVNMRIISENPYITYVSPFNFGIDPRATSINDAFYIYEKFEKTVKYMKGNSKYKNTKDLKGTEPEINSSSAGRMSQAELDDFKTVKLYEIHYRSDDGIYILVISQDGQVWNEHYHDKSIYPLNKWQYEILAFNKHGHKLYPISDMTKIRNFQDRLTSTVDAILEQVDRFVPKIAYETGGVTDNGKTALIQGDIGALVECNKNPNEVFKELNFTQLKADLKALVDQLIDLVTIQTGLTRAQLTGVSVANTATEATISQGGQTLRLSDMGREVNKYLKRQAEKLWVVIKNFVELEQLQLINGVSGIDEQTGLPKYNWLTIDEEANAKIQAGEYDFDIEVGSTQKPDLAVVRKQFENLFNILARTDVIALMQQQGKKVDLSELLRMYLQLYPEVVKDIGKVIQNITQQTTNLVDPAMLKGNAPGGTTAGSNMNAMQALSGQGVPNMPSLIGGE